ncbi:MAG: hypothetical protein QG622_2062 [Actinomycetota bacterium]|nr:hypothetical protein [Actinomycetota bacterium]
MTWAPMVLVFLVLVGWYLSYSASRLDRLHHRVESSRAALDAQLARRAAAALEAAPVLDPATGLLLTEAAAESLAAAEDSPPSVAVLEEVENDLTRALNAAFSDPDDVLALRADPVTSEVLDLLGQACLRVQLARRFHNDAVAQAERVHDKRIVRVARLAGHAERPQMIEMDVTSPPGLVRGASS